jgi:undecaprenyl-diphosphatase
MTPPRGLALLSDPRVRLCAGTVALLWTALAAHGNRVGAGEARTFRAINELPDALYPPGWMVMQLGNLGAVPAAAGAAWLAGDRELADRLLTVGSVTWLLAKGVKYVIRRDRPGSLLPDTLGRGPDASGLGYLSGHAGVAFALGAAALPRLSRPGRVLVLGAISTVAVTRVYVGAHLPLDIVGGAALGVAVEAGLAMLTTRRHHAKPAWGTRASVTLPVRPDSLRRGSAGASESSAPAGS